MVKAAGKIRLTVAEIADQLGKLKARRAELDAMEQEYKQQLLDARVDRADGKLFTALVLRSDVESINYRGLVERLAPSARLVKQFTEHKERVQVRVTARSSE